MYVVFKYFLLYNYNGDTMKHIKIRLWVKVLFAFLLIFTLVFLYAKYIEPNFFKVKEYSIIDSSIPDSFYGFKIVQISDIHYKTSTNYNDLKKIVKEINLLKPDIVVLTGDLFNKNTNYEEKDYNDLKKLLKEIDFNIAKYAIKGDNDIKSDTWEDIMSYSDFTDLNDKYELVYNNGIEPILIVGISSNYKKNHIKEELNTMYENLDTNYKYSILLLHEPDFVNYIDNSKFNLILAGHSLGGRIKIPFIGGILKNKYSEIYDNDFYDLDKTKLYISNGIGTGKVKLRLFNTPSISLYRLRNK